MWGVSPPRRQKTPLSVEMTRSFVEVEENRQRQVQEQVMAVFGTLIEIGKRLYRYGDGKRDED
jgi:hypothetical protein